MKFIRNISLAFALAIFLTGCFEVDTKIYVDKNGKGQIIEKVIMTKQVYNMLNEMFGGFASLGEENKNKKKKNDAFNLYDIDKLKSDATNYGADTKYKKSKKISNKKYEGYEVTYTFSDINKVKINQNPGDRMPDDKSSESSNTEEYITFTFEKGSPSSLIIKTPKSIAENNKKKKSAKKKQKQISPEELESLKETLKDLKISMSVILKDKIIKTNATYVDKNKVTLMAIDFGKFIDNFKKFEAFANAEPETLEEAKKFLTGLDGIKIDMNDEIKIEF